MDLPTPVVILAKLAALALFVYGFVAFVDQAGGQLLNGGVTYLKSPYIWGSYMGYPLNGFYAFQGLLMALAGFFVIRINPKESDIYGDVSYFWTFLRALVDTLILFFALCLVWEVLLSIYEPAQMYLQVIQFLRGTNLSNTFVMNYSAIMLAVLSVFKLRGSLFGWLQPRLTSKKFNLGFGFMSLSFGTAIFVISLYLANSFNILSILAMPGRFSCNEGCYFVGTLDVAGGGLGVVFAVVGLIVSMERQFSREPELR